MTIQVTVGGQCTEIQRDVLVALFDNSVVYHSSDYRKALARGAISLEKLVALARKAEVPYPLLFAPREFVQAQLAAKTRKLLQGVTKEQFSMNARGRVELRDVELIVKDLLRKQELYKRYAPQLPKNPLVGCIARPRSTTIDACILSGLLHVPPAKIQAQPNKAAAVECFIEHLEARHILVARSVQGYMPQSLTKVRFSGMTVRDPKAPYMFLAGGNHDEHEEPTGRQLFTLALLTVLVGRKQFRAVTMDGATLLDAPPPEYAIAAEMLMPEEQVGSLDVSSLDAIRAAADVLKVTPSALVVRAHTLRLIGREVATSYLEEQSQDFRARPKAIVRSLKPVNAVRKYNGRRFTRVMLAAVEVGAISPGEFCRVVGGRRIGPDDLAALGRAVR